MSYKFIEIKEEIPERIAPAKLPRKPVTEKQTMRKMAEEFRKGKMIIAQDCEYSVDDYSTGVSNNVLVVGSVGCGKTRSIVTPNIHAAIGSYVITDPKGNLYGKYGDYLKSKGYDVILIDFINPERSAKYNPFSFIRKAQDVLKLATVFINKRESVGTKADPFWDNIGTTLLCSLIGYLYENDEKYGTSDCNITQVMKLLRKGARAEEYSKVSELALLFDAHKNAIPESWAYEQFENVNTAPIRTYDCIRTELASKLSSMDTPELKKMLSGDEFSFRDIANRKTAVFVNVSDTDRSLDALVNAFFNQAMNELCYYADTECENNRLPIPVRFILDDFATNCKINEFPRMISSFRSRAISVMLMIQAESQLKACYGEDASTIISNCDTYAYLGGNDLVTQKSISERCDRPMREVSAMPVGNCWVFRRGSKPVFTKLKNPDNYIEEMLRAKGGEKGV